MLNCNVRQLFCMLKAVSDLPYSNWLHVQGKASEAANAVGAALVKYKADPTVITQALAATVRF